MGIDGRVALVTIAVGGALLAADFEPAFLAVGLAAALSGLIYLRLPADAGAEVSGHGAATVRQAR